MSVHEDIMAVVQAKLAIDMERHALNMILHGQFPSRGWGIGVHWHDVGNDAVIRWTVFSIPPPGEEFNKFRRSRSVNTPPK